MTHMDELEQRIQMLECLSYAAQHAWSDKNRKVAKALEVERRLYDEYERLRCALEGLYRERQELHQAAKGATK